MEQSQAMSRVLLDARQVDQAMRRMRGFGDIHHYTIEINRLRTKATASCASHSRRFSRRGSTRSS